MGQWVMGLSEWPIVSSELDTIVNRSLLQILYLFVSLFIGLDFLWISFKLLHLCLLSVDNINIFSELM